MSSLLDQLSLLLGLIALFLGVGSLLICILSLLVIGVAAPLGLMKIDLTEEMEDFSTSIDEAAISLVAVPGRASRHLCSLLTFALLASFDFLGSNLARTVQHSSLFVRKITKLLITALSWPGRCIHKGARILLSSRSSHAPEPSPTARLAARLEQEIQYLRGQAISHGEDVRKLYEKLHMHRRAQYAAEIEANQAKSAKRRQDALVARQQKTIETLQKEIEGIPQEHLQLRKKNAELEQKVNELEGKLGKALDAQNDAEERKRKTADKAISSVTDAQKQQHLAEAERDQAESYFEKAKINLEERLKASTSQIFNLKKEIAKKSLLDPRIFSQTVEQVHTLHSERDDARDALISVTAQLGEARTAEAAGQRQLKNLRAELALVENQTGRELYTAQVELAKTKAEAQKEVKAARSKSNRYWRKSEADRKDLIKVQHSLEDAEREHGMEIFKLGMKHDGEMQTAQSKINNLEASTADLRALRDTLDEKLMHAENEARLPRDPELLNRLTLATAELQRVRDEHTAELKGVRKEHERELPRVFNDYATELQNREQELLRKCEEAFNEHLAKWRVEEEKLGQQVDHCKSRADRAEGNVMALNRDAERIAHEREQREKELTATLQRCEQEAIKRCEQAYGAGLQEHEAAQTQLQGQFDQLQGQFNELQGQLLSTKEELEDLRASNSQGNQLVVAEDPAASAQVPQTLPASELEPAGMTNEEWKEWFRSLTPAMQESIRNEYGSDFFDLEPAADSAVPLQTSPTSPPLEPAPELQEPEPEPTFALDPQLTRISTPAQAPIPLATPQQAQAAQVRPILTPYAPSKGMVPGGPRKPKPKPNHYRQQRREEEAAYDAGLGPKLVYMFFGGSEPARGAPAAAQSVPSGIPGSSGFDFSLPPVSTPYPEPQEEEESEEE